MHNNTIKTMTALTEHDDSPTKF